MRNLLDMDTIQIEVTNACRNRCANCTRYVGHYEPWFMPFDYFKDAVDSMIEYPKMVGIQGGEPLLHPDFERMCVYLRTRISDKKKLGLWTTLPTGYEHYREIICKTFGNIFINDHTRPDIYHHPSLVAIKDVFKESNVMWYKISHCWTQESWSASINPLGTFFCEMAASMSMLYKDSTVAWKLEPGWWNRQVWNFKEQIEYWCPQCGMACNLKRKSSIEIIDDISQHHFDRLKDTSQKIKQGSYNLITNAKEVSAKETQQLAAYKDTDYRNRIARRYGIFTYVNSENFWTPVLLEHVKTDTLSRQKSILQTLVDRHSK